MPFIIKKETNIDLDMESLKKEVEKEATKYLKNILATKSVELAFLKSVIYLENLMSEVNEKMHSTNRCTPFSKHIEYFQLFKEGDLNFNFKLLEQVREFRNKIAHTLDYDIEKDESFFKMVGSYSNSSLPVKQKAIANFFKDLIHGPLFIKIGMENSDDFITYSRK